MTRALALAALLGCALAASACGAGGASQSPATTRRLTGESGGERDEDAPRFVIEGLTLPEPPVSVDVDDPDLEPIVREAGAMLGRAIPVPEDTLGIGDMRGFVDGRLAAWMDQEARSVRVAWVAMQRIEAGELGAHVVARALVGTTLLELASRVATLPLPRAVREDTTARLGIREALVSAARPLLERATQALGACASAAVGASDPTVDEWRVFCDAEIERAERVPRPLDEPPGDPTSDPSGEPARDEGAATEPAGSPSRAGTAPRPDPGSSPTPR
jgi:hypothetical protein